MIAVIHPLASPTQINDLYLKIRGWEEVFSIHYVFPEEVEIRAREVPPDSSYFEIILGATEKTEEIAAKLGDFEAIEEVITYKQGWLQRILASVGGVRVGIIVALGLFFLMGLFFTRGAIKSMVRDWRGELEIARLSGVSEGVLKIPFLLGGGALGLLGALLTVVLLYLLYIWLPAKEFQLLPAIMRAETVVNLSLGALVLGLLLGFVGGGLGTRLEEF